MPMITVRALRVARRAEDAGKLAELRSATQAWVALFRLHFPAAIPTAAKRIKPTMDPVTMRAVFVPSELCFSTAWMLSAGISLHRR